MPEISVSEAIAEALDEEMDHNDRVYVAGEDVGQFGGTFGETQGLMEKYGEERVRDTPLAEIGIVGHALGAAVGGLRPVAELQFADFAATAGDEMINQVPKRSYITGGREKVPLTVLAPSGASIRAAAEHSQSVHSWISNTPGWIVVTGTTPYDTKGLLKSAIRNDNPVFFMPSKALSEVRGEVPDDEYTLPLGEAVVEREGSDVTVVATQLMFHRTLEAAEQLAGEVEVDIVNPRTFSPLDTDTIANSVRKTGRLVVVDETPLQYGIQSHIVGHLAEHHFFSLDAPPKTLGVKTPVPFSPTLEEEVIPTKSRIIDSIRSVMEF